MGDESNGSMQFPDYMGAMDALMWRVERDPIMRSGMISVMQLDRDIKPDVFRAKVAKVVSAVPRLRQIVVQSTLATAPPRFIDDRYFDLNFHTPIVAAPGEGRLEDVLLLAENIRTRDFDKHRPLWEFVLVSGCADGGSALLMKVHHAVTDAVGGLAMIVAPLLSAKREGTPSSVVELSPVDERKTVNLAVDAQRHELSGGLALVGSVGRLAGRVLRHPRQATAEAIKVTASVVSNMKPKGAPLSPIMTGRSLSVHYDHLSVPFDELRTAAKAVGGRFNDAFVASVVGGLGRYHVRCGSPVEHLRMFMPVNLREGAPTDAGNAFAGAVIEVPTALMDPSQRIDAVQKLSAEARAQPALRAFPRIAGVASRMPSEVIVPLYRQMSKSIDFVTSNVPGPPEPLFIANARIDSFYAFGPIAGSAINVTAMTYAGTVYLAVQSDPAAVPDASVLLECIREGFDEVLALAS